VINIPKLYKNTYRQETTFTGSGSGVANELSQMTSLKMSPRVQHAYHQDFKQEFSSLRRPKWIEINEKMEEQGVENQKSQESSRSNSRSNIQSSINRRKRLKKSASRAPKLEESGISSPSVYSRVSPSRYGSRSRRGNQIRDLVHLAKQAAN
jgi:hypothetical protein